MKTFETKVQPKRGLLANDLVFTAVMRSGEICKCFLEHLLGLSIDSLEYPEKQKDLTDSLSSHGARLDVFVTDRDGNAYNIEMQSASVAQIEKRARFYAAAIDRNMLRKGEEYSALQKNIVIFICSYDAFGLGLAEYAVLKTLAGPGTDISCPYDDGAQVFFLNANYNVKNADAEITDFLDIVRGNLATTDFGKTVTDSIDEILQDDKRRRQVMTLEERLQNERRWAEEQGRILWKEEGLAEGRAEGEAEGKRLANARTAQKFLKMGWSKEEIAAFLETDVPAVEELLSVQF